MENKEIEQKQEQQQEESILNVIQDLVDEDLSPSPVKEPEQEQPKKEEEKGKEEEVKPYTNEELEQLLTSEPNKIDLDRVSEAIKPLVSAQLKQVQTGTLEQIQAYAQQLKQAAEMEAQRLVEQQYGMFDPMNPEHVTLYNQAVMQGQQRADNLVKAYALVQRLKNEDGEVFDKAIEQVRAEAERDPIIAKAWEEADIAILYPVYERVKARLVRKQMSDNVQPKEGSKQPPNVIEPSLGSGNNQQENINPEDLAGLDVDSQAALLVKMGLLDE